MKKFLLIFFLISKVYATDYYVTKSGNDANSGLSKHLAWLTIEKANNTLVAGDIVHVFRGVYSDTLQPANNGLATARITYQADDDSVILYSAIGGSTARNFILEGTLLDKKRYITIDGFWFAGYTYFGYITHARDIIIRNCIVRKKANYYIDQGFVIQANCSNISFYGNIMAIRGNASTQGRFAWVAGDSINIVNNTFVQTNTTYQGMTLTTDASYVTIKDNIFLCSVSNANPVVVCDAAAVASSTVGINYYYNFLNFSDNLIDTTEVVKADPLLWQSTYASLVLYTGDYHTDFKLRSTSPCIGTSTNGLDVGAEPNIILYLKNE